MIAEREGLSRGGRLGIIGGHSVLGLGMADALGRPAAARPLAVRGGPVEVLDAGDTVFLQRHGTTRYTPAHRVDHHAHAQALSRVGVDRVLALASVGSLRTDYPVGTVLIPDDFIGLGSQPDSRFPDERGHSVPGFDARWRTRVRDAWRRHAAAAPVDGATYWQVTGPRFETPAEVRFLAAFADVVGMTVASECIAMRERDIAYAAVCIVDNLANGLGRDDLTMEEFEAGKAANRAMLLATLAGVVRELAA